MSRLTGNDAKGLMEAYNAVYVPQELTEEQIWEEVENWVNSLLEEGYDLSEYTWEEMYESYIEEQGGQRGSRSSASQTNQSVSGSQIKSALGTFAQRTIGSTPIVAGARYVAQQAQRASAVPSSSGSRNVRGGGTKPSAAPKPAPPAPAARPAATLPSKPAAPAPRPAAPAPRPAAPTVKQTGDKAKDMATWAKANPTLASRVTPSGTQAGTGQSQMAKQAAELRAMRERSQQRQGVKTEEYDAYDLVLEYLLSQGHADTVEEANYVMLEMDAEMIYDIVSNYKN